MIKRIESTGFLNNTNAIPFEVEAEIEKYQSSGGFPMKWPAVIAVVVIWNALFLGDQLGYFSSNNNHVPIGMGAQLALAFAFLFCLAILISPPFSRLVLKDGRTAKDIRSFLLFLMLISGFMFTVISLIPH